MVVSEKKDTKGAILDSAERLMAAHGTEGVSLRQIMADAGANPAALHYHFRTREKLIEAILARRGPGINHRRRAMLAALEARGTKPTARDVVDAVVDPMIELIDAQGDEGRCFIRFLARLHSDRTGIIQKLEQRYFPDVIERIGNALEAACAGVPRSELGRRVMMMMDAMLQSLGNADAMHEKWDGQGVAIELRNYAESLKCFLAGGLSAPPPAPDLKKQKETRWLESFPR